MGYRAQKKHAKTNTELTANIDYLTAICKDTGYEAELAVHKVNQVEGNIELVLKGNARLSNNLGKIEDRQREIIVKLDKLINSQKPMIELLPLISGMFLIILLAISAFVLFI